MWEKHPLQLGFQYLPFIFFFFLFFSFLSNDINGICQVIKMRALLGVICSFRAEWQNAHRHIGMWLAEYPSTELGC